MLKVSCAQCQDANRVAISFRGLLVLLGPGNVELHHLLAEFFLFLRQQIGIARQHSSASAVCQIKLQHFEEVFGELLPQPCSTSRATAYEVYFLRVSGVSPG